MFGRIRPRSCLDLRFSWWTLASVEGVCVCRKWFNRSAAAQGLDLRCYPRNRGRGVAGLWCPCLEDLYQGVWGPDPCTVLPRWRLATAQGIPFPPGPGLEGPFHPQPWGSSEGRASLSSPPGVLHLWRPAGSPSMAASSGQPRSPGHFLWLEAWPKAPLDRTLRWCGHCLSPLLREGSLQAAWSRCGGGAVPEPPVTHHFAKAPGPTGDLPRPQAVVWSLQICPLPLWLWASAKRWQRPAWSLSHGVQ